MSAARLEPAAPADRPRTRSTGVGRYARALKRESWVVLGIVVVAVAAAILVSELQSPVYRASTRVVVGQGNALFPPASATSVEPFTQTMAGLLKTDIVARNVIRAQHLNMTPHALLDDVRVSTTPESAVLSISYDSGDKARAVTVLSGIGNEFTRLVRQKLGTNAGGAPVTATIFDPAHLDSGRVSPHPLRNALLAGLLGLLVGIAVAAFRESLRERVDTRDDAESWLGAPVIGAIPDTPSAARARGRNGGS